MKSALKKSGSPKILPALIFCLCAITFYSVSPVKAEGWKAGSASIVVTPGEPAFLAGYGNRTEPSQGIIHDIHVKALALEGPEGNRAVITTADLIGVSREFSNSVSQEIFKRYAIPREALLFNTSHTHCGPEVRHFKKSFYDIPDKYKRQIDTYIAWLEEQYILVISEAIEGLTPAVLQFSSQKPTPFAVSRRFPTPEGIVYRSGPSSYYTGGPRDDIVPALSVTDTDGTLKAVLFGYACHPITLRKNLICGDYPGFAQDFIEESFPGVHALFVQGCCGELVPNARYQVEYAIGHGKALADAVQKALGKEQIQINGTLKCAYDEVTLDFQPVPDRKILEENLKSGNNSIRRKAAFLLEKLDNNEAIEITLPCPLQVIRIGEEVLLIGLCGEPVVDYAVKLKSEFPNFKFVWVAGYCNYEFGYLPTWKVLKEGGYEGGEAMIGMPHPGPFTETVEQRVLDGVRRLVDDVSSVKL